MKYGSTFCWGIAALASLSVWFDYFVHAPKTERGIDAVLAAVWTVGAMVLTEMAKWRKP